MITLIMLMYCMSTVHIALALQVNLIAFFNQHAIEGGLTILDDQGNPLVWVQIMLELLNVGDCLSGRVLFLPCVMSDCGAAFSASWAMQSYVGGHGFSGAETGAS